MTGSSPPERVCKRRKFRNIFQQARPRLGEKNNKKALVLDADLTKDAGSSKVMLNCPDQFFQFGISEQDMVSFGSGLAAKGFLPIFHSFSCFLSTRSQEQIFNYCSEKRKGI